MAGDGFGNGGNVIVRRWQNVNAPTGEGERFQTADGRCWKPCMIDTGNVTGRTVATYDSDRIKDERPG